MADLRSLLIPIAHALLVQCLIHTIENYLGQNQNTIKDIHSETQTLLTFYRHSIVLSRYLLGVLNMQMFTN